jgi:alpha-glucuronidase
MRLRPSHAYFILLLTTALVPAAATVQAQSLSPEDGYEMWLRYELVTDASRRQEYISRLGRLVISGSSPTASAIAAELERGLSGILGTPVVNAATVTQDGTLVVGTPETSPLIGSLGLGPTLQQLGPEGFVIREASVGGRNVIVIASQAETGALYGAFHLLRLLQSRQPIAGIRIESAPRVDLRIVNHWDNLDRTVERGYAGISLWDWGTLPHYRDPRYADYARINASLGINGTVLNNVNANALILTPDYLEKVAVLAEEFRPYGLKVYLSINFFAPMTVGGLSTADPVDPTVRQWWKDKVDEIYRYVPDFGGFLVKANSEGQPGPQSYGRDHATGANMFAEALAPHGGVVMWRAFVYDPSQADRFREAYDEFVPLDGRFQDNVIVQVKNGPIDFQPREPFSPLFGAIPRTNTMLEVQITQEYFGFATNLTYLGPMFTEVLNADTHVRGEGSTVARVVDGSLFGSTLSGMAGVINPGTARNWTGHPFVQSSWYAFGRLAWDHGLSAEQIAEEWVRLTFGNDPRVIETVTGIMMVSREAGVNYRMPLGLTHLYAQGDHYGPGPWQDNLSRPDWNPVYYHRADANGIGFDRTATGSNAVAQYQEPVARIFRDLSLVPDEFLLWFHRLPWTYRMRSGRTLWDEMVFKYYEGVDQVRWMGQQWATLEGLIDPARYHHVKALLDVQVDHAIWWRDACILYFQTFSGMPIPEGLEAPRHDLDHYLRQTEYIPIF